MPTRKLKKWERIKDLKSSIAKKVGILAKALESEFPAEEKKLEDLRARLKKVQKPGSKKHLEVYPFWSKDLGCERILTEIEIEIDDQRKKPMSNMSSIQFDEAKRNLEMLEKKYQRFLKAMKDPSLEKKFRKKLQSIKVDPKDVKKSMQILEDWLKPITNPHSSKLKKEKKTNKQQIPSTPKGKKTNKQQILPTLKGKKITQVDLKKRLQKKLNITDNLQLLNGNKLLWVILPPAACKSWSSFEPIFDAQLKTVNYQILEKEIEEQKIRFKRIFELKPKKIFRGIESFSDYFALIFEGTSKVVLESVVYGNAVYIVYGNWMEKSQQTKSQLKKDGDAKVIHHRGDWFLKIKNYLQIGVE